MHVHTPGSDALTPDAFRMITRAGTRRTITIPVRIRGRRMEDIEHGVQHMFFRMGIGFDNRGRMVRVGDDIFDLHDWHLGRVSGLDCSEYDSEFDVLFDDLRGGQRLVPLTDIRLCHQSLIPSICRVQSLWRNRYMGRGQMVQDGIRIAATLRAQTYIGGARHDDNVLG